MQKCTFTDQMGRSISLDFPPKRIISLVPSQTELLFDLGLDEEIVGITKFCIHPKDKYKSKVKVGGTKKLNMEMIRSLKPDLIIANKEENEQVQMEELMLEFPVWMSDITLLEDALEMIEQIGALTGTSEKAFQIASSIEKNFSGLKLKDTLQKKVAYFIWKDPYMLAAKNTFIDQILARAGFANVSLMNRYPIVELLDLKALKPDLIFLSSEPYPFKDEHVLEMKNIFPDADVFIVDGELFSWYGSRLRYTADYLLRLLEKINCHS
jgi:ABC-type Fe3+-hydroxamate transport system substrate-binding protein